MVRPKPGLSHGLCAGSIPAFIGIVLLLICTEFAAGEWQNANSDLEQNLAREHLENCLKSYIAAAKGVEVLECPGALGDSFSKKWTEFIRSDLILLEHQTRYLILSADLQTKNRDMDEVIALLAETRSRIETLQGIAHRFASRCPVWATRMTPFLEGYSSSVEKHRDAFRCLARSLLVNLSRRLVEAHSTQGQLRARQQDALSSLAQTRSDRAAQKERLDAALSSKKRTVASIMSGSDGERAVSAVLSHCRMMLLSAVRNADVEETRGISGELPRRLPPPVASKPDSASSADCALGPTQSVAPLSPVFSVAGGGVVLSEYIPGFGLTVVMRHSQREMTVFSHLAASFVCLGDQVNAGQKIGLSGESGLAECPSLLFALLKERKFRDLIPRISWPGQ